MGNQNAVTSPVATQPTTWYDELNRRTAHLDALGDTTYYLFDPAGRQVGTIDPLGSPTYFQYDVRGQQIAVTDALGNSSYFQDRCRRPADG